MEIDALNKEGKTSLTSDGSPGFAAASDE